MILRSVLDHLFLIFTLPKYRKWAKLRDICADLNSLTFRPVRLDLCCESDIDHLPSSFGPSNQLPSSFLAVLLVFGSCWLSYVVFWFLPWYLAPIICLLLFFLLILLSSYLLLFLHSSSVFSSSFVSSGSSSFFFHPLFNHLYNYAYMYATFNA